MKETYKKAKHRNTQTFVLLVVKKKEMWVVLRGQNVRFRNCHYYHDIHA